MSPPRPCCQDHKSSDAGNLGPLSALASPPKTLLLPGSEVSQAVGKGWELQGGLWEAEPVWGLQVTEQTLSVPGPSDSDWAWAAVASCCGLQSPGPCSCPAPQRRPGHPDGPWFAEAGQCLVLGFSILATQARGGMK